MEWHSTTCKGATAFARVPAIRGQIHQIIEKIEAGSSGAEPDEQHCCPDPARQVAGRVSGKDRDENQDVLYPLVRPHFLDKGRCQGIRVFNLRLDCDQASGRRRYDMGCMTMTPLPAICQTGRSARLSPT